MTPAEVIEAARRRYNSVGDSFWSDEELYQLVYDACLESALECKIIERVYTSTTVAGTQDYDFPTNAIAIKRITYNGQKLKRISQREDDAITGLNQSITSQGTSAYYWTWNDVISLRPLPDSAVTLKIWTFNQPQEVTNTSTLEVPAVFHMGLVNYVVAEMSAKDSNFNSATYYMNKWEKVKKDMKAYVALRKRTDSFAQVQDEEQLVGSYLGMV